MKEEMPERESDQYFRQIEEEKLALEEKLTKIQRSLSWRITFFIRVLGPVLKKSLAVPSQVLAQVRQMGGFSRTLKILLASLKKEGFVWTLDKVLSQRSSNYELEDSINSHHKFFTEFLRPMAEELAESHFLESPSWRERISLVMPVFRPNTLWLDMAVDSVLSQTYADFQLIIVNDGDKDPKTLGQLRKIEGLDNRIQVINLETNLGISGATNEGIQSATGALIGFIDQDDLLERHALATMGMSFAQNKAAKLAYSDEDKLGEDGRFFDPHFKPAFDPIFLHQINYISHLAVFKTSLLKQLGPLDSFFDGLQDHELLLRASGLLRLDEVVHVPHILYHWRAHGKSTAANGEAKGNLGALRQVAAERQLQRSSVKSVVSFKVEQGQTRDFPTLSLLSSSKSLVSIVIPSRDAYDLLSTTVESIRALTKHTNFEIIIVDNGSTEVRASSYLKHLTEQGSARVLRVDEPFNFSRLINKGVDFAAGEFVCLLNNDVEITDGGWLEEMLAWAELPSVGAVGARLWYPDGRLQHGGVVLGLGGVSKIAGHAHKFSKAGDLGYMGRAVSHQIFSAVTGAALLVSKEKFRLVGGLDERLQVAFNDVDFCLKLLAQGFSNVWSPLASLIHHESATRGIDKTSDEIQRASQEINFMLQKWPELDKDLSYHPLLMRSDESFRPEHSMAAFENLKKYPFGRVRLSSRHIFELHDH